MHISRQEYGIFRQLIYKITGLSLNESKRMLLLGRLTRRLNYHGLDTFSAYYRLLTGGQHPDEIQIMVDLMTTNETCFFREAEHFSYLSDNILGRTDYPGKFRVWSAACSSGEEAYSIAMTLAEILPPENWEIVASDISARMLRQAASGHYALTRTEGIPQAYLKKYCLKGIRQHAGTLLIAPELRRQIGFYQQNLTHPLDSRAGNFDVIFLRNVMIYFDAETKNRVLHYLLPALKPGGYLLIGHSETLNGLRQQLVPVEQTIYRKP